MSKVHTALLILWRYGFLYFALTVLKKTVLDKNAIAPYSRWMDDVMHQKCISYLRLDYWPDIRNPDTFNEKVLHRMLFGRDDRYTMTFDKLLSREYAADRWNDTILPEIYDVVDDPSAVTDRSFPGAHVIKSSLGSGDVRLIDDVENYSREEIRETCQRWLEKDYEMEFGMLNGHRYYDYERLDPKIIIEERISGHDQDIPRDYKFYVFHGRVQYVQVDYNRYSQHSLRFFDRDWNAQSFRKGGTALGPVIEPPDKYEKMVEIAETLAEGFNFIRVDLYLASDGRVLFGELTLSPGGGAGAFEPARIDTTFGKLW
jgi:hypothetical protein